MKNKTFNKKLNLNKQTVAFLDADELKKLRAGNDPTFTCDTCPKQSEEHTSCPACPEPCEPKIPTIPTE